MSKTINGVTTTYYLNGSQILGEETNGNVTLYVYDASGSPIGMQYHGANYAEGVWDIYWYEKNIFGDIIAVYDEEGTKLISYIYEAYGHYGIQYFNSGSSSTAANNPFRYRGYYYDKDLGLYYLNTRYYDSSLGRFISPDSYVSTGQGILSYNMYAYCNNNPVMNVDPTGEAPKWFETWMEYSFVYNVIIKSTTVHAGIGVGIIYPVPFLPCGSKAEYAIELTDGKFEMGEFGESSASLAIPPVSITYGNSTYTRYDGMYYEEDMGEWDVVVGADESLSYGASFELSVSISLKKLVINFIEYGDKYWWGNNEKI